MSEARIEEWVSLAISGDQETTYKLWEIFEPLRSNWARQTSLEVWSREDLQQQSYLILVDALQRYDASLGMGFAGYYKTRLSVWRSKQGKRKRCESSNVVGVELEMYEHSEGSMRNLLAVEDRLFLQDVVGWMKTLGNAERAFFIDSILQQVETPVLMQKYGLKAGSVRSKKKRLRDQLKKVFEKN